MSQQDIAKPHSVDKEVTYKEHHHYLPITRQRLLDLKAHIQQVMGQWGLSEVGEIDRIEVRTTKGYSVTYEIEIVGEK